MTEELDSPGRVSREGEAAEQQEHDLPSRPDEGLGALNQEGASAPLSPADPAAAAGPGSREPSRPSSAGPTQQQQQQQQPRRPWLPVGWNPPRPGSPRARSSAGASLRGSPGSNPESRDASPRGPLPHSSRASPTGARLQPAGRQPHSPASSNTSPQTGQGYRQRQPHSPHVRAASPQKRPAAPPISKVQSPQHRSRSPSGPLSRAGSPVNRGQPGVAAGVKGSVAALSPLRIRASPERLAKGSSSPERLTDSSTGAAEEHTGARRQQHSLPQAAAGRTAASNSIGSPLKARSTPSTPSSSSQRGQQLRAGGGRSAAVHSSLGALPSPGSTASAGTGVRHSATAVLQTGVHDGGSMGKQMSTAAAGPRLMVKADPALRPVVWEGPAPGSGASSPGTADSSPARLRAGDHGEAPIVQCQQLAPHCTSLYRQLTQSWSRVWLLHVCHCHLCAVSACVGRLAGSADAPLQVKHSGGRAMQQTEPLQLGSRAVRSGPSCPGLPLWALMRQCSRSQVLMPAAEGLPGIFVCSCTAICSHSLHHRQPCQASSTTRD